MLRYEVMLTSVCGARFLVEYPRAVLVGDVGGIGFPCSKSPWYLQARLETTLVGF